MIIVPPLAVLAAWVVLFALYGSTSSSSPTTATPPQPPPNLNPGNIPILGVAGSLKVVGTDSGMVVFAGSSNLCPRCPVVPQAAADLNPPQARFTFFFNLTDSGGTSQNVSGFAISVTGGSGTDPFSLYGVLCCSPGYGETTELVFMTAGQTLEFEAIVTASAIPTAAGSGYNITLQATYSSA